MYRPWPSRFLLRKGEGIEYNLINGGGQARKGACPPFHFM